MAMGLGLVWIFLQWLIFFFSLFFFLLFLLQQKQSDYTYSPYLPTRGLYCTTCISSIQPRGCLIFAPSLWCFFFVSHDEQRHSEVIFNHDHVELQNPIYMVSGQVTACESWHLRSSSTLWIHWFSDPGRYSTVLTSATVLQNQTRGQRSVFCPTPSES